MSNNKRLMIPGAKVVLDSAGRVTNAGGRKPPMKFAGSAAAEEDAEKKIADLDSKPSDIDGIAGRFIIEFVDATDGEVTIRAGVRSLDGRKDVRTRAETLGFDVAEKILGLFGAKKG